MPHRLSLAAPTQTPACFARIALARAEATEVLKIDPGFSIGAWMGAFSYRDQTVARDEAEALRRAGSQSRRPSMRVISTGRLRE